MEFGLRDNILKLEKSSYAKEQHLPMDLSGFIDCSNGINPLGVSKEVEKCLASIPLEIINTYPKSSFDLKEAIVGYWSEISQINNNQVILGDGSIELIYKINKIFIDNESKVLGYSPQFSDYIDDVETYGGTYECYLLSIDNNFKFITEQYISKMNLDYKLFYIDNPNNPTGQVIDILSIEEIVKKAKSLNLPVIIDEAYGDFIDKKNSAISLINKFDNLIVIRTFSKGLGLAGVRAGYVITSKQIANHYSKVSNPYEMNSIARYLALAAMKDKEFMAYCNNLLRVYKQKFIDSLKKLKVLETNLSVPIMTIMHPDKNVDLESLLLKHNVLSISGQGFIGLGKNSVRIMITRDIDSLISAFNKVENEI